MPLLSIKSTSEVIINSFFICECRIRSRKASLPMLELVTKLRMPSTTRELIECLSKVLDGTLVTCGSGISRGPDVMFRVSFSITIMSLVLSFKS